MKCTLKKVESETFESMILSFATNAVKHGIDAQLYQILVQEPTREDPFYTLKFNALVDGKVVYSSEGGMAVPFTDFSRKEMESACQYGIPLEIIVEHQKAKFI